ncbi:hypothetical protein PV325_011992 [Microctonus aethiopoides]|nr:hypothetical protein PV325_011992 [Microctonus aethiopoides]
MHVIRWMLNLCNNALAKDEGEGMGMFVAGVAGGAVFYTAVFGMSIWAAASKRKKLPSKSLDDLILANRGLGLVLGILTLVATWIGGVFINGTAEAMFDKGLAWCQVPIGYSLSLLFSAMLFIERMRKAEYVTMLDPFQQRYGARLGGLLFLPTLFGDLFWCAAIIKALANTIAIIAEVNGTISVCTSGLFIVIYTIFGGIYMASSTDALQFACIMLGLAITTPYAMLNRAVSLEKDLGEKDWLGEVKTRDLAEWIDGILMLTFGGIPWQGYFQRIFSIKSISVAKTASVASTICCLLVTLPSALIGLVGRSTDWSLVEGFNRTTLSSIDGGLILPIIFKYLTPQWVAFIGLGTISVTVMSSANSSILSSSYLFTRNIYRMAIRPKASDKELAWILRITILIVVLMSMGIALTFRSVYYLSFVRILHEGGEKELGLPPLIHFPYFDHRTQVQKFPFRTAVMATSVLIQLTVSFFTRNIFGGSTCCPRCCDFLGIYSSGKSKEHQSGVAQSNSGAALLLIDSAIIEGSAGRDSTDSQEEDRPSCEDSRTSEDNSHYGSFGDRSEFTLRRGMSVQNTPISKINRTIPKNVTQTPGRNRIQHSHMNNLDGQILGVRNLPTTPLGQVLISNEINQNNVLRINNPTPLCPTPIQTPGNSRYGKLTNIEKAKENDKVGDRSSLELNLNLNLNLQETPSGHIKKNVVGVKLIGMDGTTTFRRPSQGTFSPTPSVELVHILDRRQSGSSFGPTSLSPVPGVEACKIHGTAVGGSGNEQCRIKRGIVRHHSFNETGDRALTTLARQPAYPSMPLRTEDCRMTLLKKDRKPNGNITRHASVADEKILCGRELVLSPTYSMYESATTASNYLVADDEAISRF